MLWALTKPWSPRCGALCWHLDLHLQPRLSGPFPPNRSKKQNGLEPSYIAEDHIQTYTLCLRQEMRKGVTTVGIQGQRRRPHWRPEFHGHRFSQCSPLLGNSESLQGTSKHQARTIRQTADPESALSSRAFCSFLSVCFTHKQVALLKLCSCPSI